MATIKEFKALRPAAGLEKTVSELPYDVVNTSEARDIAGDNNQSFFHVTRPEIGLSDSTDPYSEEVYQKGKNNLDAFISDNTLQQDSKASFYAYTLIMSDQEQTGLVACVNVDDYFNDIIKKHEYTREDKENDRTKHLDILNANTGPVFLLYKEDGSKEALFKTIADLEPLYDFVADDGVRHIVRKIDDDNLIQELKKSFRNDILYIADGHHRAASGARVGKLRREKNSQFTGEEEFNYFLTVIFPHNQLAILPYNRAVKDLNNLSEQQFLDKISEEFSVSESSIKSPEKLHTFSMYINKKWYELHPKFDIEEDPINSLDVKILQDYILDAILNITNPRKDKRIDFIGGIRGTQELEKLVNSGEYAVAFSMFPTTVEQLIKVSDSGNVMPPKSTWFEPKLRSGLFIHLLE